MNEYGPEINLIDDLWGDLWILFDTSAYESGFDELGPIINQTNDTAEWDLVEDYDTIAYLMEWDKE